MGEKTQTTSSPSSFSSYCASVKRYGKINASRRAVYCTNQYIVEQFGPQMPIAVTESLIYIQGARTNSSVNVSAEYGWGWFVCNRKLLVWPVVPSLEKIPPTVIGRELTLPSSDLSHNANLVTVFIAPGYQTPSCIAVSPEGIVRYWNTIGQYSSWVDVNTNLGGEEVCAVRYIPPFGCLAVTTTASMILLSPGVVKGKTTVVAKHVTLQSGWLHGIGRRMSSIIFGIMPPSQSLESKIVKVLTKKKGDCWHVYLMAGLGLQSWLINSDKPHEMLFECDLSRLIEDSFPEPLEEESEISLLDMKHSEIGLVFLAVCTEPRNYILVEFNIPNEKTPPTECSRLTFFTKNDINNVEGDSQQKATNLQFLPLATSALLFNNKIILGIPIVGGEQQDGDKINVPGGIVFGGHMYNNIPLFFSGTNGFVSISPLDSSSLDVLNTTRTEELSESISEAENKEPKKVDFVSSIKTSFIYYVRKNIAQCKAVINRDFPQTNGCPVDSLLSITLVKVSVDILSDMPVKDPRWTDTKTQPTLPAISSLHLENQLLEKLQAHDLFLLFVKDLSLWEQLGKVTQKGHPEPVKTINVLCEHNEKIIAAIVIRSLQKRFPIILDCAMKLACQKVGFVKTPELNHQDYFFRHLNMVDEGLRTLCDYCYEIITQQLPISLTPAEILSDTNNVIIDVIQEVIKKREEKGAYSVDPTYLPWIAACGSKGIYDHILRQVHYTYSFITERKQVLVNKSNMTYELFLLCDIILYIQQDYPPIEKFRDLRTSLIRPFLKMNEQKLAAMLGEKYKDFDTLIELCYILNNENRLSFYMEKFGDEGFCEFTFDWYSRGSKKLQLLNLLVPPKYADKFSTFLEKYPRTGWLFSAKTRNTKKTCQLLSKFGLKYSKYGVKKERILALAKMAAVVGDNCSDLLPEITRQFQVARIQKEIPNRVLTRYGFDSWKTVRAFSAQEIIQLFICEENIEATETDFESALNCLIYLDPSQRESSRNDIWAKAVLRDRWTDLEISLQLELLHKTLYFKLMLLIIKKGKDPANLIPSVDCILAHEDLQFLSSNTVFRYIFRYGYEQFCETAGIHLKTSYGDS